MASVRERSPGRWQLIVFTGNDGLTGKKLYTRKTVDAENKRAAQLQANEWELDLLGGDLSGDGGTFGELFDLYLQVGARRWSPSTLRGNRSKIDTYLRRPLGPKKVDHRVGTQALDQLYGELAARGGVCQHRPCRRPLNCGQEGHPKRCQRADCIRAWTCEHDGACKTWEPCENSPCEHGRPLTVSTVVRLHALVQGALALAVDYGWMRKNPADAASPGVVVTEEAVAPDDEDVILLLADAEEEDYALATYLALAIEAGPRRGAQHALRWSYWSGPICPAGCDDLTDCPHPCISEIRFQKVISIGNPGSGLAGTALVERPAARNKRTGRATLGPHVTAMLVRLHDDQFERAMSAGASLPADAFLFSNDVLGAVPWHPDTTSHRFARVRDGLDLNDAMRLHSMRHMMVTQLLATPGISPKVVQERGGWRQLHTMLGRYPHSTPANDRAAAGVVDRIYGRS